MSYTTIWNNPEEIIVTAIHALAGGAHRSWIPVELLVEVLKDFNMIDKEISSAQLHGLHRAAKVATKAANKLDAKFGWSAEHVCMLARWFVDELDIAD